MHLNVPEYILESPDKEPESAETGCDRTKILSQEVS